MREPAASVVACADEDVAKRLQQLCHSPAFRPYTSVDVLGCELGGAYKNVVGLVVGMAVGLGFGDNTTASLITRGLAETARLASALGANPLTLMGLAGLGDLVATCSSPLSRNRSFGEKLGQGMTVRRDPGLHPSGGGGGEVLRVPAGPGRAARRGRPHRDARRRRGRRPDHRDGDDERVHHRATPRPRRTERQRRARPRSRRRATRSPGQTTRSSSARRRSSHRSSTSSMPTDIRTRPSGIVAGSDFQRRRRSKRRLHPAQRGGVHPQLVLRVSRSAAIGALRRARSRRCRRTPGSGPRRSPGARASRRHQLLGVGLRALDPQVQRAQPAQGQPGLEGPGHGTDEVAPALEHGVQLVVAGAPRRPSARRCARRGTSSPSAPRGRRSSSSGVWSRGVAKVLSTTT